MRVTRDAKIADTPAARANRLTDEIDRIHGQPPTWRFKRAIGG